ncbi:phosphate signaling complex protein PhoU [Pectinatus cerevisiiphilus]|uniref:Phosphate-specific transport system accessory protein PhoU n=1 Tax=Pectinatus cerevisiiphilus TaxID=86956 RepID=A0A4R3K9L8_9FIRM|nr:phosphate signaling complex protein PhoU [Pectinatus cerevisiiphilus]TCS79680.1 PhoU-like phosphate uptake regulator [Pectinatus cerevisiiphilus]
MENQVTRKAYIEDLARIQEKIVEMGIAAETAAKNSIKALLTFDKKLAAQVMESDDIIDKLLIEIEDSCILLIAKQQPIAHDLRVIATSFKISTDLERIGDHAFDIAKITYNLKKAFDFQDSHIKALADCAISMINMSIKAYKNADVNLAEKVCIEDDNADSLFAKTLTEISNQTSINTMPEFVFTSRYLERIGDHATNIAEWVIYLETAERIRKTKKI